MVMAVAQKSQAGVKVRNTRDGIDAPTQRWKPHRSDVCTEVLRLIAKLGAVPAEPLMVGALIRTPATLDEIEQALADLVRQGLLVQQARNGEIVVCLSAAEQRKQPLAPALRAVAQVRGITEDPFAPRAADASLRTVTPRSRQASEQPFTDVRAQRSQRSGRVQRESEHPFTDVQRNARVSNLELAPLEPSSRNRRARESEFPFTDLTQGKAPSVAAAARAVRAAFEPPTLRAPELTAELLRSIAIAAGAPQHVAVEPMQRRPESTPAPALAHAQLANPADVLTISMVDAKLIGPELVARAQQELAPRTAPPVPPPGGRTAQAAPLAAAPAAIAVARGSHAAIAVPSTALTETDVPCGLAACAVDAAVETSAPEGSALAVGAVPTTVVPAAGVAALALHAPTAIAPAPEKVEAVAAPAVATSAAAAPTERVEEIARLEVALDAERERLVLYRLGVVMLTLTGLVLARQLFLV